MFKIREITPMTNEFGSKGYDGIIEFDDGKTFLGNIIRTGDHGNEIMIFECSKEGKVSSWCEVYVAYPESISKELLEKQLKIFGESYEEGKRKEDLKYIKLENVSIPPKAEPINEFTDEQIKRILLTPKIKNKIEDIIKTQTGIVNAFDPEGYYNNKIEHNAIEEKESNTKSYNLTIEDGD